jgi:hypothetical protein
MDVDEKKSPTQPGKETIEKIKMSALGFVPSVKRAALAKRGGKSPDTKRRSKFSRSKSQSKSPSKSPSKRLKIVRSK